MSLPALTDPEWAAELELPSGRRLTIADPSGSFGGVGEGTGGGLAVIIPSSGTRLHLALQPVDLRGSFNALSARVKSQNHAFRRSFGVMSRIPNPT